MATVEIYCPDSTTVDYSNENYTNTVFIKYIFLLKQVDKILPHCFIGICHSISGKCQFKMESAQFFGIFFANLTHLLINFGQFYEIKRSSRQ